jgi:transaldolase
MPKAILEELAEFGQSIWLDNISRRLLTSGELKQLIAQGLRGMTSNPSIFNKAIGESADYDDMILKLKSQGKSTIEIYDELTIRDIREAADQFRGVYEKTQGLDGYVSLEINPLLANQVDAQIKEGGRLFERVNRPNVMIKVPSTQEGIIVVEELISRGININVTLIFSVEQYTQAVQAYFRGLQRLSKRRDDLNAVHSVASVFVSRVDSIIDKRLEERVAQAQNEKNKHRLRSLFGRAAVANCRVIFEQFKVLFDTDEFKSLFDQRANVQRVLWGSTSTKNPAYRDIKYVEELITKPTVNTVPDATLKALLGHGTVKEAFAYDVHQAEEILEDLYTLGIDIDEVCDKLLEDGCKSFNESFESLIASIEKKAAQLSLT